ncbi:hypothetical protein CXG81DRAFT_15052 [Caulochytrium protostelioides]|uniref:t-SNARE coiled-coil homology domain-containing protein n=1 Tax=Caulochytrium protostelioides TaxID=1555241 RepID=A0A4P9X013_9FUNG|nr:hypothetical protein CXG81DRAFT_15052 [Caulochytrium protostelioides]|eukprot:RKO99071.1 hypothetical protein CXG81DRAFT_15052 [Caulochytrium protostelioides]
MLLLESEAQGAQTAYSRQRAGGVDALETAVAELGQLYTHFTQLLAGQRDVVMRIDQDVFVAEANTRQAHSELLKYYTFVGSRRRGMLQVFVALLLVFFLMRLLL